MKFRVKANDSLKREHFTKIFMEKMDKVETFYEDIIDKYFESRESAKLNFEHQTSEDGANYFFVRYRETSRKRYQITFMESGNTVGKYNFQTLGYTKFSKPELELIDKLGFELDENHTRDTGQIVEDWWE